MKLKEKDNKINNVIKVTYKNAHLILMNFKKICLKKNLKKMN